MHVRLDKLLNSSKTNYFVQLSFLGKTAVLWRCGMKTNDSISVLTVKFQTCVSSSLHYSSPEQSLSRVKEQGCTSGLRTFYRLDYVNWITNLSIMFENLLIETWIKERLMLVTRLDLNLVKTGLNSQKVKIESFSDGIWFWCQDLGQITVTLQDNTRPNEDVKIYNKAAEK